MTRIFTTTNRTTIIVTDGERAIFRKVEDYPDYAECCRIAALDIVAPGEPPDDLHVLMSEQFPDRATNIDTGADNKPAPTQDGNTAGQPAPS